jgi:hypothetical protein
MRMGKSLLKIQMRLHTRMGVSLMDSHRPIANTIWRWEVKRWHHRCILWVIFHSSSNNSSSKSWVDKYKSQCPISTRCNLKRSIQLCMANSNNRTKHSSTTLLCTRTNSSSLWSRLSIPTQLCNISNNCKLISMLYLIKDIIKDIPNNNKCLSSRWWITNRTLIRSGNQSLRITVCKALPIWPRLSSITPL